MSQPIANSKGRATISNSCKIDFWSNGLDGRMTATTTGPNRHLCVSHVPWHRHASLSTVQQKSSRTAPNEPACRQPLVKTHNLPKFHPSCVCEPVCISAFHTPNPIRWFLVLNPNPCPFPEASFVFFLGAFGWFLGVQGAGLH